MDRKPMTEDRMMKLAKARERALEVRRQAKAVRMQAELERMKEAGEYIDPNSAEDTIPESEPVPEPTCEEDVPQNIVIEEEEAETIKPKRREAAKKKRKNQKVIIEQDSSDSDEFESNDHVIFVKRSRARKQPAPLAQPRHPPQHHQSRALLQSIHM